MKTKIQKYSALLIAFSIIAISSIAYASYGSNGNQNDCPNPGGSGTISCTTFHNNGYTGADGTGGNFPNGTTFATFNGYKDQETEDGRAFDERQFVYIESEQAAYPGRPYPSPWENESDYNFAQGTSYTINFNGTETQRVGVWGYLHNNGIQNEYPAYDTTIRFSGWSQNTPQLQHSPQLTISGSNTRPTSVWSNITINGSQPFTLTPVEAYLVREDADGRPGTSPLELRQDQIQTLTSTGAKFNSNPGYTGGRFDSSHVHYAKVYLEFEATPSPSGVCRSLTITDPAETSITLDENGFVDENLSFNVDADANVVSGYRVLSTRNTVTFDNSGQSNLQTNKTTMVMDGGPTSTNLSDTVQVWALDKNGNGISNCMDSFNVKLDQEENACEVLATTPTPPGQEGPVPLNEFVTINIDELTDTNGDAYLDNGATPQIRYCYNQDGIQFLPDSGNMVLESNGKCAVALATDTMSVIATEEGNMNIKVVGASTYKCEDEFQTQGEEIEGACLDLSFLSRYESFNLTEETDYCVTVDVEEEADEAYNDNIRWTVERGEGNVEFTQETQNQLCLDFEDYPEYDYEVGDTLIAQAIDIEYEGAVCEDELTSDGECTRFDLDRDTFERGTSQEVCIDYTDWPLDENDELEYSVDNGSTETVDLYEESGEICFLLTEDMVEDADLIRVWVPGYEDECNHELTRNVEPPSFDKNAKSADASAYSSRTIANFSDDYVNYRITYTHYNDEAQDVTITDTIGTEGYIQGYIAGTQTEIDSDTPEGGRIYYNEDSMRVFVGGDVIEACDDIDEEDLEEAVCYERNIGDEDGVIVRNVPSRDEVLVEYRGEIRDSSVNPENCSDPDHALNETGICGEIYPNVAQFEDEANFEGSADAEVVIPCPFIIIRAGGDVFLENPFDYGVDTLSCSEIRTSDTPVIVGNPPDDRDLVSTGGDVSMLREYNDRLCNSTAEGSVDIEGISSLICELELTSEELTQQAIVQSLSRNVQLFARYSKNLNGTPVVDGSSTLDRLSSSNNVYVKDDGMLTLGGEFAEQARTIVVLNNDVYINKNLTFKDPTDLSDPRKVPSLAVIVIGGNIVIDPKVEETQAIFFVQEGAEGKGGQVCEAPKTGSAKTADFCVDDTSLVDYNSEKRLTHYGSIYGDIQHLLKYRVKSGDPTKEEGAILIRFDNRVYLNTPPLLNKLVDVSQKSF